MFYRYWIALACGLSLLGCPSTPTKVDGGADGGADAGPIDESTTVRGDYYTRYIQPNGVVAVGLTDLSTRTIFVYLDGPDGGLAQTSVNGAENGTFALTVPPQQRYLVLMGDLYVSTTTRTVHLGQNAAGRPDVFVVNPNEGLSLTATNVDPWQADDELQLASWGAGLVYFSSAQSGSILKDHRPDAGDTSFSALTVNMEGSRVVDVDAGDDFFLTQLAAQPMDGGTWKTVTRTASPPLYVALGALTPLSVAFTAVPQQPISFSIDTRSFEGVQPDVGAEALAYETRALVDAHLGSFGENTITDGAPDLGILVLPADAGTVTHALTWGNPYPSTWTPFVSVGSAFEALYRAPFADGGVASARSEVATISRVMTMSEATSGVLSATISPAREVRIDGKEIGTDYPTVSRAPLVSWKAPALGTVSRVDIQPIELQAAVTGTKRLAGPVLRVVGETNQVRLPENFLVPGATHYLRVTVVSQPANWDPTWPLRDVGPPAASATMMTRAFNVEPLP